MDENENVYCTSNLGLNAYLKYQGFKYYDVRRFPSVSGGEVVFFYEKTPELMECAGNWNSKQNNQMKLFFHVVNEIRRIVNSTR